MTVRIAAMALLAAGCATSTLRVGPDGRVKSVQYWKNRPATVGWSITF